MRYEKLTNYLKKQTVKNIELSYSDLANILESELPKSMKNGGVTKTSGFGKAALKAGYDFSNSYQKRIVYFKKDKTQAEKILEKNNTKSTNIKTKIFLNVIFPQKAGYFNSEENVGHEIIDIFGADDNNYYYYFNPWGMVANNNVPDVILSVCLTSQGLYKILNKAVIDSPEKDAVAKKNTKENLYEKQKGRYKYNDKFLEEYYKSNKGGSKVLASFKCKGIYEPKKPLYLAFDAFKQRNLPQGFYRIEHSQGQTTKFVNFNKHDQTQLERIVGDSSLWKKEKIKAFKEYAKEYEEMDDFNYFKELGIESQELQYSNALRFFLEHYNLKTTLLKKLWNDISIKEIFYLEREKYNIDLFFTNFNPQSENKAEGKERIVIIENKIKASITPTDKEKTTKDQLFKIYKYVYGINPKKKITMKNEVLKRVNEIIKVESGNNKLPSQLSKYYIYAVLIADKRGWTKTEIQNNIKCFFLCPEYSKVMYNTAKGLLSDNSFSGKEKPLFLQEQYKLVTYKEILPIFTNSLKTVSKDKYKFFFEDFINSMKTQTKDRDDSLEQKMIKMFYLRSKAI